MFPVLGSFDVLDDGSIVITYTNAAVGGQRLYAVRSEDSGKSFGPPFQISVPGQNPIFPAAVSDGKGTIFTTYQALSLATTQTPIFAAKSIDGGRTFSTAMMISPSDVFSLQFAPVPVLGSDGTPYVLYHSFNVQPDKKPGFVIISGPAIYLVSAPDGTHFTPATPVAAGVFAPAMVLDRKNNIYISYVAVALSGSRFVQQMFVTRSCDKGASFSIPIRASDTTSLAVTASAMQLDQNGNLILAWSDGEFESSLQTAVTRSVDGGVTFGTTTNLSSSPGDSVFSFITSLPDGSVAAVYPDDSPQNRDLFSAVLPPPPPAPPDFSVIDQALRVSRGEAGKLVVSISRPGNFTGRVTVRAPSNLPRGVAISQSEVMTTTTTATFDLAVARKHVGRGTIDLLFNATDESGRRRSGTISLAIQ